MTLNAKEEFLELEQHFFQQGWIVAKLPDPEPIFFARDRLLLQLRKLIKGDRVTLEEYHELADNDTTHYERQISLTQFYCKEMLGHRIIEANLNFFKTLMGPDLDIQRNLYLRITRPGKPQDNIQFHRDTFYGTSPFEVSVIIPFVDVPKESSLSVLSGSHVRPDSDFPHVQIEDSKIVKGSPKHKVLGFLYAPKLIDPASLEEMKPIPLVVGEVLIFILSLIHGSEENRGTKTRWSSDIRLVNSLASLDLSARPEYYMPLCRSVVTDRAFTYLKMKSKE